PARFGVYYSCCVFFFFQAEDGIRDFHVTRVQTCALPICPDADGAVVGHVTSAARHHELGPIALALVKRSAEVASELTVDADGVRSEERRVGKECRCRWSP